MSKEAQEIFEKTCLQKGCLAGEVAVITGSTSNVGLGYAEAIAWAGGNVVIVGRNEAKGQAIAAELCEEYGPDAAIFVKTDVSEAADIAALKEAAIAKYGKVDILINNAMNLGLNGPILGSKIEDMDMAYRLSTRAVMLCANAFVPDMVARGHGFVTFSSTQFHFMPPMIGGSIYCSSKAGATAAMMSLANEVKGTGVYVNCICPAGVGQINPDSVDGSNDDYINSLAMPGFEKLIPKEAAGAAMVFAILNAEKMHGTGTLISDALVAMDYPFPKPETVVKMEKQYLDGFALTMVLCAMGHGYDA
ncbi:MAG: SDR family oxidoreductase [Lachnospiraceae bacterium]|nr:SDR family oxidoreductase [Lachnospiraceae bacterium]